MPTDANPGPEPAGPSDDDLRMLAGFAAELADGVEAALPAWVLRCVESTWAAWAGEPAPPALRAAAEQAGLAARDRVGPRVRDLLGRDVDDQPTNPLSIVRSAVVFPTEVLREAGVPEVVRDDVARRQFPDDAYDLTPVSFAELDPALHEPGLAWGAAKAHVHLARRRAEGRR